MKTLLYATVFRYAISETVAEMIYEDNNADRRRQIIVPVVGGQLVKPRHKEIRLAGLIIRGGRLPSARKQVDDVGSY